MQPTTENPSGELPQPQPNRGPVDLAPPFGDAFGDKQQGLAIEQSRGTPSAPSPDPSNFSHSSPLNPLLVTNSSAGITNQSLTGSPASPLIADDSDLIEKEWVAKAKHIVERTRDDPYLQTKEINKMKADYLKKRYAKDIVLPED